MPSKRTICLLIAAAATAPLSATARAQIVEDMPDAIVCAVGGDTVVSFIDRVRADGSAVYSSSGDDYVIVGRDGVVSRRGAGDCHGRSLDDLREDGQTVVLRRR